MTSFHQVNRPHGKSVRCQPLSFKDAIFQPVWYSATSLMGTQTTLIPTSKQKIMLQFVGQPIRLKPSTWKPYGQFKSPLISPASPLTGECVIPLCLHSSPFGCGSMSAGDLFFSAAISCTTIQLQELNLRVPGRGALYQLMQTGNAFPQRTAGNTNGGYSNNAKPVIVDSIGYTAWTHCSLPAVYSERWNEAQECLKPAFAFNTLNTHTHVWPLNQERLDLQMCIRWGFYRLIFLSEGRSARVDPGCIFLPSAHSGHWIALLHRSPSDALLFLLFLPACNVDIVTLFPF